MKPATIDSNGTSLVGYVRASFQELVDTFGYPNVDVWGDDKSSAEWHLQADDGTIATVYDYYTSGVGVPDYLWHIGGFNMRAADLVREALGK